MCARWTCLAHRSAILTAFLDGSEFAWAPERDPAVRGRRALGQPVAVRTADRVAHPAPWGQLRGAGGGAAGRVRVVRHPILGCFQSV
jgi:hypothetical protein